MLSTLGMSGDRKLGIVDIIFLVQTGDTLSLFCSNRRIYIRQPNSGSEQRIKMVRYEAQSQGF